jgi:Family of unknown function (DUF6491)
VGYCSAATLIGLCRCAKAGAEVKPGGSEWVMVEPERAGAWGRSTMNIKLLSILGLVVVASAPALAARSCLQVGQIFRWNAVNDKTLIVADNWENKYKLSLMVPCPNLDFAEHVGFEPFGGTSLSCLSKGDDVVVSDRIFPKRCPISEIVPYTPQMEAADKAAGAATKTQQNK